MEPIETEVVKEAGRVAETERAGEPRRENTREQILEATRTALCRFGYENITTRDIAREAGVNIATLHYYFRTKEALLEEAMQFAVERAEARFRTAIEDAPDASVALGRAFAIIWEMVQEKPGSLRFDLVIRGLRDAKAREQVLTIYAAFRRLIEDILQQHIACGKQIADGLTVNELAYTLVASIDGIVLHYVLHENEEQTLRSLNWVLRQAQRQLITASSENER